jgi:hypothetical protein
MNVTKITCFLTENWFRHTIIVAAFFLPPWRWPREWSKHVGGCYVIKLHSHPQVHLLIFLNILQNLKLFTRTSNTKFHQNSSGVCPVVKNEQAHHIYPLNVRCANTAHQYRRGVPICSFLVNQDTNTATTVICTKFIAISLPGARWWYNERHDLVSGHNGVCSFVLFIIRRHKEVAVLNSWLNKLNAHLKSEYTVCPGPCPDKIRRWS